MMLARRTLQGTLCLALLALGAGARADELVYRPAAGEKTVSVALVGGGSPELCKDGRRYRLPVHGSVKERYTVIPAGHRVTILMSMGIPVQDGARVCTPGISVIPAPDVKQLVLHARWNGSGCEAEIVRLSPGTLTGVAVEPTAQAPEC